MRVGVIASTSQSLDEPFAGGMEAHTVALAEALRARGHEVTVHAAEGSGKSGWRPIAKPKLTLSDGARLDPAMTSEGFMRDHHAYLSLMTRLDDEGYDVVHNNSLHYLPVAMADSLATPLVTTLHTPPTPWLESAIQICPEGSRWISVSHSNASSWSHLDLDPEVVYNGVDLNLWREGTPDLRDKAVWSGRFVPEKGPHFAALAARRAGLSLDLVGPLSDPAYFEREVEPLLGDDIRYLGHLGSCELPELIGCAGVCLVTPCWDEPFGLVVAEALATGTPVAAFSRGAMAELLTGSCGALASPGDVEALAAAARRCLELDRADCRARAEERFSLDRMVDEYLRVYYQATSETLLL